MLDTLASLDPIDHVLELSPIDMKDDVREHLDEPPIAIVGEPGPATADGWSQEKRDETERGKERGSVMEGMR